MHGIGLRKPPLQVTGHVSVRKEGHGSKQEAGKRQEMAWPSHRHWAPLPYMPALGWAVRMLHFSTHQPFKALGKQKPLYPRVDNTVQSPANYSMASSTQQSLAHCWPAFLSQLQVCMYAHSEHMTPHSFVGPTSGGEVHSTFQKVRSPHQLCMASFPSKTNSYFGLDHLHTMLYTVAGNHSVV